MKSFIEDSYAHPDAVKKSKIKDLLSGFGKENLMECLLGQNMVYTLLFWAIVFFCNIYEFMV